MARYLVKKFMTYDGRSYERGAVWEPKGFRADAAIVRDFVYEEAAPETAGATEEHKAPPLKTTEEGSEKPAAAPLVIPTDPRDDPPTSKAAPVADASLPFEPAPRERGRKPGR